MELIARPREINFLNRHKNHHIIKVISGVRRCGKSTLFSLFRMNLVQEGISPDQIISINFEDLAFEDLTEYHALYRYLISRLKADRMNYIFLDEIQHVQHFEKAVDSLFLKENVDLYITGSNGYFMSAELATLLSGRYVELKMLPFSFREFCSAIKDEPLSNAQKYDRYLRTSSFPYLAGAGQSDDEIRDYLSGIYNTNLVKDTLHRIGSGDTALLEKIMRYLAANIGSLISPNKIANTLTSDGRRTDNKTVERFLHGLKDSLLIYQADRYDIRGKNLLKTNSKYYLVDPAFRRLLVSDTSRDLGHVLENVVYLELLHRGYRVSVGQVPGGEVDFVAETPDGIIYYQVAETVMDPNVLERELKAFRSIPDQYPKYLLTLDEIAPNANYSGIRKKNALDWMLGAEEDF